uniref:Uncharacterized protein n=1 Tax=Avena sativa TaxID=4498 RepID=A0ACD5VZU0_AVESA
MDSTGPEARTRSRRHLRLLPRVRNMLKRKRRDVPSRTKSKALDRFIDREGGVLSQELAAELSPSIVSIASFDGTKLHSQCTGIVVENDEIGASYVTSRDLVTTRGSGLNRMLKIQVRLPNGNVVNASMQYYSVAYNMFFVTTEFFPHLRAARLPQMQVESSTKLLAASLFMPDKIWVTAGELTDSPTGENSHEIMWSTCDITEAGSGGPLVDFDGNIVGMNLRMTERKTSFVPAKRIVECTSSLDTIVGSSSQNGSSDGVWCDLNEILALKLSPSIISVASFNGEALHSICTGMVIDRELSSASFLTTGSLFGSLDQNLWSNLRIKVRLPNDEVVHGWLHHYLPPYSLAVIATRSLPPSLVLHVPPSLDLHVACLGNDMHVESSAELLAVRRCFYSGKLASTRGSLINGTRTCEIHKEERKLSTCKIIVAASGGPLVDCDGNIVGMNYYDEGINSFIPSNQIREFLGPDYVYRAASQDPYRRNEIQQSSTPHSDSPKGGLSDDVLRRMLPPWRCEGFKNKVNAILHASGYPLPSFVDDGMYLKWDFEEEFGRDIWSEPTRRVASNMSRSVVALASFSLENPEGSREHREEKKMARQFACTGVFIECNETTARILTSASLLRSRDGKNIHSEWKIEVCLPSKRRVDGTLEHCNLKYNVAVISIKGVRSYRAAKLDEISQTEVGAQVVALGRGFESGKLMATEGAVAGKHPTSYCKKLQAGIGGPLVDFGGNFVGMNFYDTDQTPYLSRDRILKLMRHFFAERTVETLDVPVAVETPDVPVAVDVPDAPIAVEAQEVIVAVETPKNSKFPSWPVPDPEWFYPSRYPKPKSQCAKFVLD